MDARFSLRVVGTFCVAALFATAAVASTGFTCAPHDNPCSV